MAKNQPLNAEIQKLRLADEGLGEALMNLPAILWIKENWKQVSYGLLALLLLLVLLYRILANQTAKEEQTYFAASQAAAILANPDNTQDKREAALLDLQTYLEKSPSLHAKYDGLVAEQLLIQKKIEEATPYIQRTFARVGGDTPEYLDYAKTSILLTEDNNSEALKNAYLLKERMLKNGAKSGGILYAFNLIRIGFLEKQAQNKDLETKAWAELKAMTNSNAPISISTQDLQRVMSHFDTEGAKLNNYMN